MSGTASATQRATPHLLNSHYYSSSALVTHSLYRWLRSYVWNWNTWPLSIRIYFQGSLMLPHLKLLLFTFAVLIMPEQQSVKRICSILLAISWWVWMFNFSSLLPSVLSSLPSLLPSILPPLSSPSTIFSEELGIGLRSFQPHVSALPLCHIPSSLRAFSKMKSHVKLLFNSST